MRYRVIEMIMGRKIVEKTTGEVTTAASMACRPRRRLQSKPLNTQVLKKPKQPF